MERNYNVGIDSNNISILVNIGTTSTCYTSVYQRLTGGQKINKAESNMTSHGSISKINIGLATDLKGTKLFIQTIADFRALPPDIIAAIRNDPHALKTNLLVEYIFDGGFSGNQRFDYDYDDSVMGSTQAVVVITKEINFIP